MKILYDGRTLNTAVAKKVPYRKFFKVSPLHIGYLNILIPPQYLTLKKKPTHEKRVHIT